jgi:hypothetical protein
MLDLNKGDVSSVITGENGYYIGKIVSEAKGSFNEAAFAKKSGDIEDRLKALKFTQIQKDLLERLKVEEKVTINDKNL